MEIKTEKNMKDKILLLLLFIAISTIFLLFFSWTTSPLYDCMSLDSNIFKLMGHFTKEGMIPYKDMFDHKGPILVFVEWIGCLISSNKTGIFFVQVIFWTISLCGTYKLLGLFFGRRGSCWLSIGSLMYFFLFLNWGNTTEEICLPFLIWSTYFAYTFFTKYQKEHNKYYALFYGITFMVGAFTRLTNALPLCILVIIGMIELVRQKKWENVIQNIIFFIIGVLIIIIPVFIWFAANGALGDMIYATFIYNFKYAVENATQKTLFEFIKFSIRYFTPFVLAIIVSIVAIKKKRYVPIAISVIVTSIIAIAFQLNSAMYEHYLMIWTPCVLMAFGLGCEIIKEGQKTKCIISCCAICFIAICSIGDLLLIKDSVHIYRDNSAEAYREEVHEIMNLIPESEKDAVVAYNVDPAFYIESGLKPCYRNFVLQDFQCQYDEKMRNEFEEDICSLKAKYIVEVVGKDNRMDNFIDEFYEEVTRTRSLILLRKNNLFSFN